MTIFEFAKKMEKDGERYYRNLVHTCREPRLQKILNELADAELTHYAALEAMEQGQEPVLTESKLLATARNIFAAIPKETVAVESSSPDISEYKKALEIEKQSRIFYEQKAAESDNPIHKKLFLQIADQEQLHYLLMDSMIELLLRPFTWLENAEWHHLDQF